MGWTGTHRERGISNHDYLQSVLADGYTVLDTANDGPNLLYAAVQTPETTVIGMVMKSQRVRASAWGENFRYRVDAETSGPNERTCPARILDRLTPAEELYGAGAGDSGEWASQWRADCRAYAERIAAQPQVKPGDRIRFAHSIRFADGTEASELILVKGATFAIPGWSGHYRLGRNWRRTHSWQLVEPTADLAELPAAGQDDDYAAGSRVFYGRNGLFAFVWIAAAYDKDDDIVTGYCVNLDDPVFSEHGTIYGRELIAQSYASDDVRDSGGQPVAMDTLIARYEPQAAGAA